MKLEHLAKRFRIDKPAKFRLANHDPADCCGLSIDKDDAKDMLAEGIERLSELQERLYASDHWSVLIVLQAMDAAGKDSVIKHVMTGVNPQGVEVHSFKQPSEEELDHDFLWRAGKRLPESGRIGIFNRSYYEEVLVVRVHPELLAAQQLPEACHRQETLAAPLRRHPHFRTASRPQRHADPEVLSQRLARGAAPALPRPHRRAGQELEVLHGATSPSASAGTNTWRRTRR